MRIEPPKGINEGLVGLFSHSLFFFLSFLFLLAETFGEITCQKFSFYLILEVDKFVRNKTLSEMCEISSLKHQKKREKKLWDPGSGSSKADLLPLNWEEPVPRQSVLALQILWSHLGGIQCNKRSPSWRFGGMFLWATRRRSRERENWLGRPRAASLSPGTLLFNHCAAKQSDGELHMPLVSLSSLCLHLCLSHSASLSFLSLSSTPPLISSSCSFILPPRLLLLLFPLMDFCCKFQTTACMHLFFLFILHHKVNAYSPAEVLIV